MSLENFEASSNTTAMVHSEQMLDLGGGIELEHVGGNTFRVTNHTRLRLKDCLLISGRSGAFDRPTRSWRRARGQARPAPE